MLDSVRGVMRSAIGAAEHVEHDVETDVEAHSPAQVEAKLDELIAVMHRTCESAERHVEVVEGLADSLAPLANSLTPLADAVSRLTDQINLLLQVTAPLAAAERDVARVREITRVGGLVHRLRARPVGAPPGRPQGRPPAPGAVRPRGPGGPGSPSV